MDSVCIHFGADFKGRLKAARKILNITKNPPIIISEEMELIGCQLPLVDYLEPLWAIDLDFTPYPIDDKHCEIEFKNKQRFPIPIKLSADKVFKKRQLALALLSETKYFNRRNSFNYVVLENGELYHHNTQTILLKKIGRRLKFKNSHLQKKKF